MTYPLTPMINNILIEKVDLVERTILIEGESFAENVAKVLAVGPGRPHGDSTIPVSVKPGDYIVVAGTFQKYRAGNQEFLIMNENSIVAKITDVEALKKETKKEGKSVASSIII